MTRFRSVARDVWRIDSLPDERRGGLLAGSSPAELLERVLSEAQAALNASSVKADWCESTDRPGYFRVVVQVPLSAATFDEFINGRSGYRAQYYLSPEEGLLYNRAALNLLTDVVLVASESQIANAAPNLVGESLAAPHAKIWVFEEKAAFNDAAPDTLNPERWVNNNAVLGRRAPLPPHCSLDIKGAFIHPTTFDVFVDELKADRPCDLFEKGFT
jgi:hypothetical protein